MLRLLHREKRIDGALAREHPPMPYLNRIYFHLFLVSETAVIPHIRALVFVMFAVAVAIATTSCTKNTYPEAFVVEEEVQEFLGFNNDKTHDIKNRLSVFASEIALRASKLLGAPNYYSPLKTYYEGILLVMLGAHGDREYNEKAISLLHTGLDTLFSLPEYHSNKNAVFLWYIFTLGYSYASINNGDYDRVSDLTIRVINSEHINNELKSSILEILTIVHLVQTGNSKYAADAMHASLILHNTKSALLRLNPISTPQRIFENALYGMVNAYREMNEGKLREVYKFRDKMLQLYNNRIMRFMTRASEVLHVLEGKRALVFGLGGYGAALAGNYSLAKEGMERALLATNDIKLGNPGEQYPPTLYALIPVAYAEIVMRSKSRLSTNELRNAEKNIKLGYQRLKETRIPNDGIYSNLVPYLFGSMARTYIDLVYGKYLSLTKGNKSCFVHFMNMLNHAIRTAPKELLNEALYVGTKCGISAGVPTGKLKSLIDRGQWLLVGYEGPSKWQYFHARALIEQNTRNIDEALSQAHQATVYLDKYRRTPIPRLMEQLQYFSIRTEPYELYVDLLIEKSACKPAYAQRILQAITKLKYYSIGGDYNRNQESKWLVDDTGAVLTGLLRYSIKNSESIVDLYYSNNTLSSILINKYIEGPSIQCTKVDDNEILELTRSWTQYFNGNSEFSRGERIETPNAVTESNRKLVKYTLGVHDAIDDYTTGIILVPHRDLHLVGWGALPMGDEEVPDLLLNQFDFRIATSAASVFKKRQKKFTQYSNQDQFIGMIMATDVPLNQEYQKLSRTNTCCALYSGTKVNVDLATTVLSQLPITIIYGHGEVKENSPTGFKIHLPSRSSGEVFTYRNIPENLNDSRLVVLLGCATGTLNKIETAINENNIEGLPPSDNLFSLYRAFLKNGATHLLVSMKNDTDSHAVNEFIMSMVRSLLDGNDVSTSYTSALRLLKNGLIDSSNDWAGLLLVE